MRVSIILSFKYLPVKSPGVGPEFFRLDQMKMILQGADGLHERLLGLPVKKDPAEKILFPGLEFGQGHYGFQCPAQPLGHYRPTRGLGLQGGDAGVFFPGENQGPAFPVQPFQAVRNRPSRTR